MNSDLVNITCGAPMAQPWAFNCSLLFLIYINNITKAIPNEKVKLFADDTNLSRRNYNISPIWGDATTGPTAIIFGAVGGLVNVI